MKKKIIIWIGIWTIIALILIAVMIDDVHNVNAFREEDILLTSYMVIIENGDEVNRERTVYDKTDILRINALLSNLKYIRKEKEIDAGGYSLKIFIYDEYGNKIKQVKLLSEDILCVEGSIYHLKNKLMLQEIR